ncbi:zinc finger CCCH domain-containing protein 14 isoform X1 [Schistocerca piceifrons]|uniref:zinc finger CCCH domain-containing protein 14 isoform X1 n=1 Tax=Schistocerca piceifrons TaxID=274613 RepID=UPI001F5E5281|nr:zinc finger CCCH domain-containing protein 14 isoform X1 [Schistocerca piceifrons]
MEGIGGEISSKIRAAIKSKLMEMGAYVDEELPDYVMVMVANKRSKSQMADDLQLFLGKSTEQFTNWLQQVLSRLQEVAAVNSKTLTDTKKVQSRISSDEAAHKVKSASKLKCEQVTKPKPEHPQDRAGSHRSEKKHTGVAISGGGGGGGGSSSGTKKDRRNGSSGSGAATEKSKRVADGKAPEPASAKTKIVLMNSDDDEEDFINIKADAEAEALLKAELPASAKRLQTVTVAVTVRGAETAQRQSCTSPEAAARAEPRQRQLGAAAPVVNAVSARDVTAAVAHSTSGARKVRPTVRRVVTAPASVVAVATKRSAGEEDGRGPAKRAAVCVSEEAVSKRSLASTVGVTDRLGVRPSGGPSIKDRLGTRGAVAVAAAASASDEPVSRPGARNPTAAAREPRPGGGKVTDRLGPRPTGSGTASAPEGSGTKSTATAESGGLPTRLRVTDRLGTRRGDAAREAGTSRKRAAEGGRDSLPEVAAKRPAAEGPGSRLARRLRELAEGPGGGSARVAHVPPNNIRQGGTSSGTGHADCRPSVNSQVVPTGARESVAENRDVEGEVVPAVALPSVVRVTPRPRLPASMQANKNLLLKAVAEAQRSVAAAAASVVASASGTVLSAVSTVATRHRVEGRRVAVRHREEEEDEREQEGEDNYRDEALQNPEGIFTRCFLNRENFAVTVSNESGAVGDSEEDEQFDDGRRRDCTLRELRGAGRQRPVVTTAGKSAKAFMPADTPQQITIQLSPEGSRDGDSSSEREDEEVAEIPPHSAAGKDDTRSYDGQPVFEDEDEEEEGGPVATVAAIRPTVVTTVPHMDMEPVARPNPQFVVTLDGLDVSMFPNAGTDDDEGPADPGCPVDRDVSKVDSGSSGVGRSAGTPSTGRATIVQRVEPRLRLGPMPSNHHPQQQQLQRGGGEVSSIGSSSGSGIAPAKTAERCKYWPACRMGGKCTFHHPTQTCRAFPACKFGEKCLYIHPNCKFDAACTRRDCPYTHSSPRLSAAAATRGSAQSSSGTAVCRFFPGCTNPACRFLHPKACKYGRYCVKPGCTFQHDGVPTTDKLKWVCPFRA